MPDKRPRSPLPAELHRGIIDRRTGYEALARAIAAPDATAAPAAPPPPAAVVPLDLPPVTLISARVAELWEAGELTEAQIAQRLGVPRKRVHRMVVEHILRSGRA